MRCFRAVPYMLLVLACAPLLIPSAARAQRVDDLDLHIETYLTGLSQPTGMRFFAPNEGFLIEKDSGQVKLFDAGAISSSSVLDLDVQNDSERGLLGMALDPDFTTNQFVYLYYSATSASGDSSSNGNWSGNQLAKYQWDSATSTLTSTGITSIISSPAGFTENGPNHNGGPLVFSGGNLYGVTGDLNRNGVEQNNNSASATTANVGGVYRLNTDLTPAAGNPFTESFAQWYSYGVRNSFGLAVDPVTGNVWDTENGTDSYDEINLIQLGMNGGWSKIQGPDSRDSQIGLDDLNMLPGAFYSDPEFSFRSVVAPTSIQFLYGSAWGPSYNDAVVVGDNNTGRLYLLRLNANRSGFDLTGGLADLVADTDAEVDLLAFGHGFGTVTDLQIGTDGALYLTSLTDGNVYRIAPLTVPEPQTWAMLAPGLILVSVLEWRRRKRRLSLV